MPAQISIHEAYTGLDALTELTVLIREISIHEAYTGLDDTGVLTPQIWEISIHEAYTGLDRATKAEETLTGNFNPRGLYRPRPSFSWSFRSFADFNPRGLYRPRLNPVNPVTYRTPISIHEAYTGLDEYNPIHNYDRNISIHEAYTGLDPICHIYLLYLVISIHEAYTGLDPGQGSVALGVQDFNPRGLYRPRL